MPSAPPPPDAAGVAIINAADAAGEIPVLLEQFRVYVAVPAAAGITVCVPFDAMAPLQLPDAVHPVLLIDDQVIVTELPTTMEPEDNVTVGAGGAMAGINANAASAWTKP